MLDKYMHKKLINLMFQYLKPSIIQIDKNILNFDEIKIRKMSNNTEVKITIGENAPKPLPINAIEYEQKRLSTLTPKLKILENDINSSIIDTDYKNLNNIFKEIYYIKVFNNGRYLDEKIHPRYFIIGKLRNNEYCVTLAHINKRYTKNSKIGSILIFLVRTFSKLSQLFDFYIDDEVYNFYHSYLQNYSIKRDVHSYLNSFR
jgi:hypothetical protein